MSSTLVLGMGNPILSDDGVGLIVAQRLRAIPMPGEVDVGESEVGGLRLLELMRGYGRVIIIDAIKSDRAPGEIVRYEGKDFSGGHRYGSAHSIHLGTVLELGLRLGYPMPDEVVVYAIEAIDIETFGEELSPPVAEAAERVLGMIVAELGASAG